MKQRTPIPTRAKHPKRGTCFLYPTTGKNVWLYIVKSDTSYLVCDSFEFSLEANFWEVHPDDLEEYRKPRNPISKNKKASPEEKVFRDDLSDFFNRQIQRMPARCENCNQPLFGYAEEKKKFVVAHILPKSPNYGFPDVAAIDDNCMFLGTYCGCHPAWDNRDSAARTTMDCYPIAIQRFNTFVNLLSDRDKIRAAKYLGIEIKPTNP
jgi:hypothetical protein